MCKMNVCIQAVNVWGTRLILQSCCCTDIRNMRTTTCTSMYKDAPQPTLHEACCLPTVTVVALLIHTCTHQKKYSSRYYKQLVLF